MTSINKLAYCGHFKHCSKSVAHSEAEIHDWPLNKNVQKWAWPKMGINLKMGIADKLGIDGNGLKNTYFRREIDNLKQFKQI